RAMNGLFPPSLDEKLLPLMKNAGFRTLNLSLGSTSGRQLKRFNRPDVRRAFHELLAPATKNGLTCVGYIIVGAPYQDPLQSVEDLLYLWRNRVLAGVSVFYPAPGSLDYNRCKADRLLPAHTSLYRSAALPLDHTTSRLEAATLLRLGRMANFLLQLTGAGMPIPEAEPCNRSHLPPSADRFEIGREMLKWFLFDGHIRGVDAEGRVYCHPVAGKLTAKFIAEMRQG
ncbi:MAG: radical SAM protein, partial [Deltaproteobacteria bacterium]|nr:radical SAM protein [Deltaproteobacteria bacterium]